MPAHGSHAPWRLWILVVAWILQLLFLILNLGVYSLVIVSLNISGFVVDTATYAVVGVQLGLVVVCLGLIITEIVQVARRTLSPLFYLVSNVIKSAIWVGMTIATIVSYQGYSNGNNSYRAARIGGSAGLMLLFLIPMLYSAIIFHKTRRTNRLSPALHKNPAYAGTAYSPPALAPPNAQYEGAHIPRPEFVDMEDGNGNGRAFRKPGGVTAVSVTELGDASNHQQREALLGHNNGGAQYHA